MTNKNEPLTRAEAYEAECRKPVSVEACLEALRRLCAVNFGDNRPSSKPRFSIPVQADDDDVLICRALTELDLRRAREREPKQELEGGLKWWRRWMTNEMYRLRCACCCRR